jgi:branched-chain amino acid transport system substrate-binding protein
MSHPLKCLLALLLLTPLLAAAAEKPPVLIGLDAEFSLDNSLSAQAIETGLRIAIDEVNAKGGVLGGRELKLLTRDNGSNPARGIRNLREFAQMNDLVAVFGGRYSPVLIEELPTVAETGVLLMAPWSSADPITDNKMKPNRVFRLSLRDSVAMPGLFNQAAKRGCTAVGLLTINTGWGRSNKAAADLYFTQHKQQRLVHTAWFNYKDTSLVDKYESLLMAGAKCVVLVANDDEASTLVKEVAALPAERRVPIFSHWGVAGGNFTAQAGKALESVDFTVVQTFSFFRADPAALRHFFAAARSHNLNKPEDITAPTGVAHAYDLLHILAKAIDKAGSTNRDAVRSALEQVRNHEGLIRRYDRPFSPASHDALGPQQLMMARFGTDGLIRPLP